MFRMSSREARRRAPATAEDAFGVAAMAMGMGLTLLLVALALMAVARAANHAGCTRPDVRPTTA